MFEKTLYVLVSINQPLTNIIFLKLFAAILKQK